MAADNTYPRPFRCDQVNCKSRHLLIYDSRFAIGEFKFEVQHPERQRREME